MNGLACEQASRDQAMNGSTVTFKPPLCQLCVRIKFRMFIRSRYYNVSFTIARPPSDRK